MEKKVTYKWCFVPLCTNTTVTTHNKHFVSVPKDVKRRKAWLKAARRDDKVSQLSATSTLYCCQDHFNMEEDMENYMEFTLMGGNYLKSKKHVVPHIFDCQPKRSATTLAHRPAVAKRNTARLVSDALDSVPSRPSCSSLVDTFPNNDMNTSVLELPIQLDSGTGRDSEEHLEQSTRPSVKEIGIQVKPHYRSKSTMCDPSTLGILTNSQTSPLKVPTSDSRTSPFKSLLKRKLPVKVGLDSSIKSKVPRLTVESVYSDTSSEDTECEVEFALCSRRRDCGNPSEDEFFSSEPSVVGSSEEDFVVAVEENKSKAANLQQTRYNTKKHPFRYLGVPNDSVYIIDIIVKRLKYRGSSLHGEDIVLLVLRKIRLNEPFSVLGDHFGISTSHATRIFSTFTPLISSCLKQLIVWPKKESIRQLLPTSFQARYTRVQSIIDCFEIEIEKPTKAVQQALTWSDYKKCNTLKYLVSATPDGVINFLSKGYGGRVSDMILLEHCGYLEKLPEGTEVMADRGFKHVENAIKVKKCTLVRPPSVSSGAKLNAAECKETKRIASLRIHIERVIRRIREFKFLTPHACTDIHLVNQVDQCVNIAAGLINLQGPIIK